MKTGVALFVFTHFSSSLVDWLIGYWLIGYWLMADTERSRSVIGY